MQAEGFSSQALQQGGIGLLMTVLIISVPPMTARFFGDTVGSFMNYSAFGSANRPGPQGQAPGQYSAGGGAGPGAASPLYGNTSSMPQGSRGGGGDALSNVANRVTASSSAAPADVIRKST
jgi:type IV secretion system protein VirB6